MENSPQCKKVSSAALPAQGYYCSSVITWFLPALSSPEEEKKNFESWEGVKFTLPTFTKWPPKVTQGRPIGFHSPCQFNTDTPTLTHTNIMHRYIDVCAKATKDGNTE